MNFLPLAKMQEKHVNENAYVKGREAFTISLGIRIRCPRELMMHYPPEQLIQMVYAIGESDGNCFLAARIYAQKYLNRSHPDVRSLQNLKERFERTGIVENCQWVHNVVAENEDFFKFMLFTDECTFHRNGFVNRHNFHYYDTQNTHIVQVNNHQHNWSINVWGGILHNYVVGPYIFQGSLTGEVFLNFLERLSALNSTCS
ncbi:hypothetical protein NQ315_011398 [Exocentrus adspersus]|uniref:DUF4817 domain-containing protein n=1 Tax=Exocentrus adspersus TaxID=1586481 RepID=A0AAV8VJX7_9CUCU|nr:hypothetical protein NQ315_011398 [Exocentrus adspersus]